MGSYWRQPSRLGRCRGHPTCEGSRRTDARLVSITPGHHHPIHLNTTSQSVTRPNPSLLISVYCQQLCTPRQNRQRRILQLTEPVQTCLVKPPIHDLRNSSISASKSSLVNAGLASFPSRLRLPPPSSRRCVRPSLRPP
jgi:hypothetical protein